jgi:transcription initiation factor TFIIB
MSHKDRSLVGVFNIIETVALVNGISKSIIDIAKLYYKKISEVSLTRGRSRTGTIAASIYMACKREGVPRSAKEVAKMFNMPTQTITRGCNRFDALLHITLDR